MKDRSMRRTLLASAGIGLIGCLLVAGSVYAQTPTTEAAAAAPAAAAAAPIPNKGDTAWMLVSSALVLMMSIPGLALFYGGLVRTKNMLSVLTQVFAIVSLVGIVWCLYGYSIALSDTSGPWVNYIGGSRQGVPEGSDAGFDRADLLERRRHSGIRLHGVPDDLRDDHAGADRRRVRRAHEVFRRRLVHAALGHVHLLPDRALDMGGGCA